MTSKASAQHRDQQDFLLLPPVGSGGRLLVENLVEPEE